jgi:hypothetical protein
MATAAPAGRRIGRVSRAEGYDTVIVACGVVAVGIAAVFRVMRIGFDNPAAPAVKPVLLALFIFTFPAVASGRLFRRDSDPGPPAELWWQSYPFLWLAGIALTGLMGRLAAATGINSFPVIAIVGTLAYVAVFLRWLRGATGWRSAVVVAGSAAFSVWASGVVWGRIYKNPLFFENFILNGNVHHDSLGLAAIGNMLRTYHVATTGIDGLNYVPYHWGTPWLFAQWSNLTGARVLDFYQLGYPVTMIPFFFGGTLAFAVAMRNRRGGAEAARDIRDDFRLWFVFLAACIGILPISGLDAMGVWTSNLLISESYSVAVPCALLLLATVITFFDGLARPERTSRARAIGDSLFVLIGIPLGIVLLGYLKISLMVLAFALAIYALARLRLYRRPLYLVSAAITTVLFYFTYTQVSLPAHREGLAPFDFLWSFVQPAWWPFFIVVHLFWSWLYILVRLKSEGIGTLADLREAASEQRILDVEAVALIAILGLGPGLITHIDGGSAFYFSDVQRWLAVGLILSRIPTFAAVLLGSPPAGDVKRSRRISSRLDAVSVRSVVLAFLLLPIVGSMFSNSLVWPLRMVRANADTRHALYPAAMAAGIPQGLHGLPRLRDPAVLGEGLRRSPNYVIADALRRMSALPDSVRAMTAVFIPQDQRVFWTSLTRPGACTFQPLVVPAVASLAMVDGMPPPDCTLSKYYGMGSFAARTRPQLPADAAPGVLCRRATAAGMNQVLMLTFDSTGHANQTIIRCSKRQ